MKKYIILANVFIFMYLIGDYVFMSFNSPDGQANINREPIQAETNEREFKHNGYILTPVHSYKVKAVVLSHKEYSGNTKANLSQNDYVLGWKDMSKLANIERIKIEQDNRQFYWKVKEFFISQKEIETSISNNHIIPSNKIVELKLKSISVGDVVELEGYLVNAEKVDDVSWKWKTSTTRDDKGKNASELFYVESVGLFN